MKVTLRRTLLMALIVLMVVGCMAFAIGAENVAVTADSESALRQAVTNANGATTIKLTSNVVLADTLEISADKAITLDLNGKTISQTKEQTAGYQMILNDGNLTITDSVGGGKISYTDSGNGGEYISDTIYNRGTLVINGGTIENLSSATVASNGYPHAVDTYSGIRDTSVTVNGGTIYCKEYSAIRMFCVSATYKADLVINNGTVKGAIDMQNGTMDKALGSLTINDGKFETTANVNNIRFANWNGGATTYGITAKINDGDFNGGITTQYVPATAEFDKAFIYGGTYGADVAEYCADSYEVYQISEGVYGVKSEYEAAIDKKKYHTLADAIAAAKDGETILVQADVAIREALTISENITIADYETYTIDLIGNGGFVLTDGVNVTFDSLRFDATESKSVVVNGGETAAANITFNAVNFTGKVTFDGKLNVTLGDDFAMSDGASMNINNGAEVVIDLAGHAVAGTDISEKSFAMIDIQPGAKLTVKDSSDAKTGKITLTATNDRDWNAYSSVISNQRGTLVVESGTIEHLGGTDMAYGIDNLTNGKGTRAETVINGGTVKSTYRAIRQFLNGVEAENILTINGGTIEGANKSVWMQDPSKNANTGALTIGKDAIIKGDVYLFVTEGSTEWPVTVSIDSGALSEGSTVMTGNVPTGYDVQEIDGNYGVFKVVAEVNGVKYQTLAEAIAAANGATVTLLVDVTENITIADGATVVIDLNGKTLNGYIAPCTPASLTVQNGSIINNDGNYSAIEINAGTLTLTNVNVSSARHGVRIDGAVTATIDGGKYHLSATSGTRHAVNVSGAADVIIKAGTFVGPKGTTMDSGSAVCVQAGAKVTIEGGSFSGGKNATLGVSGTMSVTGGTFDQDPSDYIVGLFAAFKNADGTYSAVPAVAKIGDKTYATLAEAIKAAKDGETVDLLMNVTAETDNLNIETDITLDGHGFKVTSYAPNGKGGMRVRDAEAVIKNLVLETVNDTADAFVLAHNSGTYSKATLIGCEIISKHYGLYVYQTKGADLIVSDTTITTGHNGVYINTTTGAADSNVTLTDVTITTGGSGVYATASKKANITLAGDTSITVNADHVADYGRGVHFWKTSGTVIVKDNVTITSQKHGIAAYGSAMALTVQDNAKITTKANGAIDFESADGTVDSGSSVIVRGNVRLDGANYGIYTVKDAKNVSVDVSGVTSYTAMAYCVRTTGVRSWYFYDTLDAALNKKPSYADDDNTITLLKDVTASTTMTVAYSCTIDGNGHTITTTADAKPAFNVNAANVTFRNATLNANGNYAFVVKADTCTLNIEDATITSVADGIRYTDGNTTYTAMTLNLRNTTLTVKSGSAIWLRKAKTMTYNIDNSTIVAEKSTGISTEGTEKLNINLTNGTTIESKTGNAFTLYGNNLTFVADSSKLLFVGKGIDATNFTGAGSYTIKNSTIESTTGGRAIDVKGTNVTVYIEGSSLMAKSDVLWLENVTGAVDVTIKDSTLTAINWTTINIPAASSVKLSITGTPAYDASGKLTDESTTKLSGSDKVVNVRSTGKVDVNINGAYLYNGVANGDQTVYVTGGEGSTLNVSNTYIEATGARSGAGNGGLGIRVYSKVCLTLSNSVITTFDEAVGLYGDAEATIAGSTLTVDATANPAASQNDNRVVYVQVNARVTISDSKLVNNYNKSTGIYIANSSNTRIQLIKSTIDSKGYGIKVGTPYSVNISLVDSYIKAGLGSGLSLSTTKNDATGHIDISMTNSTVEALSGTGIYMAAYTTANVTIHNKYTGKDAAVISATGTGMDINRGDVSITLTGNAGIKAVGNAIRCAEPDATAKADYTHALTVILKDNSVVTNTTQYQTVYVKGWDSVNVTLSGNAKIETGVHTALYVELVPTVSVTMSGSAKVLNSVNNNPAVYLNTVDYCFVTISGNALIKASAHKALYLLKVTSGSVVIGGDATVESTLANTASNENVIYNSNGYAIQVNACAVALTVKENAIVKANSNAIHANGTNGAAKISIEGNATVESVNCFDVCITGPAKASTIDCSKSTKYQAVTKTNSYKGGSDFGYMLDELFSTAVTSGYRGTDSTMFPVEEITLLSDATFAETATITKDVVIYGNGHKISYTGTSFAFDIKAANVTFVDIAMEALNGNFAKMSASTNFTVKDSTVKSKNDLIQGVKDVTVVITLDGTRMENTNGSSSGIYILKDTGDYTIKLTNASTLIGRGPAISLNSTTGKIVAEKGSTLQGVTGNGITVRCVDFTLELTDSTITGNSHSIGFADNTSKTVNATITGSTLDAATGHAFVLGDAAKSTITVSGSTFNALKGKGLTIGWNSVETVVKITDTEINAFVEALALRGDVTATVIGTTITGTKNDDTDSNNRAIYVHNRTKLTMTDCVINADTEKAVAIYSANDSNNVLTFNNVEFNAYRMINVGNGSQGFALYMTDCDVNVTNRALFIDKTTTVTTAIVDIKGTEITCGGSARAMDIRNNNLYLTISDSTITSVGDVVYMECVGRVEILVSHSTLTSENLAGLHGNACAVSKVDIVGTLSKDADGNPVSTTTITGGSDGVYFRGNEMAEVTITGAVIKATDANGTLSNAVKETNADGTPKSWSQNEQDLAVRLYTPASATSGKLTIANSYIESAARGIMATGKTQLTMDGVELKTYLEGVYLSETATANIKGSTLTVTGIDASLGNYHTWEGSNRVFYVHGVSQLIATDSTFNYNGKLGTIVYLPDGSNSKISFTGCTLNSEDQGIISGGGMISVDATLSDTDLNTADLAWKTNSSKCTGVTLRVLNGSTITGNAGNAINIDIDLGPVTLEISNSDITAKSGNGVRIVSPYAVDVTVDDSDILASAEGIFINEAKPLTLNITGTSTVKSTGSSALRFYLNQNDASIVHNITIALDAMGDEPSIWGKTYGIQNHNFGNYNYTFVNAWVQGDTNHGFWKSTHNAADGTFADIAIAEFNLTATDSRFVGGATSTATTLYSLALFPEKATSKMTVVLNNCDFGGTWETDAEGNVTSFTGKSHWGVIFHGFEGSSLTINGGTYLSKNDNLKLYDYVDLKVNDAFIGSGAGWMITYNHTGNGACSMLIEDSVLKAAGKAINFTGGENTALKSIVIKDSYIEANGDEGIQIQTPYAGDEIIVDISNTTLFSATTWALSVNTSDTFTATSKLHVTLTDCSFGGSKAADGTVTAVSHKGVRFEGANGSTFTVDGGYYYTNHDGFLFRDYADISFTDAEIYINATGSGWGIFYQVASNGPTEGAASMYFENCDISAASRAISYDGSVDSFMKGLTIINTVTVTRGISNAVTVKAPNTNNSTLKILYTMDQTIAEQGKITVNGGGHAFVIESGSNVEVTLKNLWIEANTDCIYVSASNCTEGSEANGGVNLLVEDSYLWSDKCVLELRGNLTTLVKNTDMYAKGDDWRGIYMNSTAVLTLDNVTYDCDDTGATDAAIYVAEGSATTLRLVNGTHVTSKTIGIRSNWKNTQYISSTNDGNCNNTVIEIIDSTLEAYGKLGIYLNGMAHTKLDMKLHNATVKCYGDGHLYGTNNASVAPSYAICVHDFQIKIAISGDTLIENTGAYGTGLEASSGAHVDLQMTGGRIHAVYTAIHSWVGSSAESPVGDGIGLTSINILMPNAYGDMPTLYSETHYGLWVDGEGHTDINLKNVYILADYHAIHRANNAGHRNITGLFENSKLITLHGWENAVYLGADSGTAAAAKLTLTVNNCEIYGNCGAIETSCRIGAGSVLNITGGIFGTAYTFKHPITGENTTVSASTHAGLILHGDITLNINQGAANGVKTVIGGKQGIHAQESGDSDKKIKSTQIWNLNQCEITATEEVLNKNWSDYSLVDCTVTNSALTSVGGQGNKRGVYMGGTFYLTLDNSKLYYNGTSGNAIYMADNSSDLQLTLRNGALIESKGAGAAAGNISHNMKITLDDGHIKAVGVALYFGKGRDKNSTQSLTMTGMSTIHSSGSYAIQAYPFMSADAKPLTITLNMDEIGETPHVYSASASAINIHNHCNVEMTFVNAYVKSETGHAIWKSGHVQTEGMMVTFKLTATDSKFVAPKAWAISLFDNIGSKCHSVNTVVLNNCSVGGSKDANGKVTTESSGIMAFEGAAGSTLTINGGSYYVSGSGIRMRESVDLKIYNADFDIGAWGIYVEHNSSYTEKDAAGKDVTKYYNLGGTASMYLENVTINCNARGVSYESNNGNDNAHLTFMTLKDVTIHQSGQSNALTAICYSKSVSPVVTWTMSEAYDLTKGYTGDTLGYGANLRSQYTAMGVTFTNVALRSTKDNAINASGVTTYGKMLTLTLNNCYIDGYTTAATVFYSTDITVKNTTMVSQGKHRLDGTDKQTSVIRWSGNTQNSKFVAEDSTFLLKYLDAVTARALWSSNGTMTKMDLINCTVTVEGTAGIGICRGGGAFNAPAKETTGTYSFTNCTITAPTHAIFFEGGAMTEANFIIKDSTLTTTASHAIYATAAAYFELVGSTVNVANGHAIYVKTDDRMSVCDPHNSECTCGDKCGTKDVDCTKCKAYVTFTAYVYVDDSDLTSKDHAITIQPKNSDANSFAFIQILNGSTLRVTNDTGSGNGMWIVVPTKITICDSTVSAVKNSGFTTAKDAEIYIENSTISGGTTGNGILMRRDGLVTIINSTITGNSHAIYYCVDDASKKLAQDGNFMFDSTLTLIGSTVTSSNGSAIHLDGYHAGDNFELTDSTVIGSNGFGVHFHGTKTLGERSTITVNNCYIEGYNVGILMYYAVDLTINDSELMSHGKGYGTYSDTSVVRFSSNTSNGVFRATNSTFTQNYVDAANVQAIFSSNGTMTYSEMINCKVVVNGTKGTAFSRSNNAYVAPAGETYGTYKFIGCEFTSPSQAIYFDHAKMTSVDIIVEDCVLYSNVNVMQVNRSANISVSGSTMTSATDCGFYFGGSSTIGLSVKNTVIDAYKWVALFDGHASYMYVEDSSLSSETQNGLRFDGGIVDPKDGVFELTLKNTSLTSKGDAIKFYEGTDAKQHDDGFHEAAIIHIENSKLFSATQGGLYAPMVTDIQLTVKNSVIESAASFGLYLGNHENDNYSSNFGNAGWASSVTLIDSTIIGKGSQGIKLVATQVEGEKTALTVKNSYIEGNTYAIWMRYAVDAVIDDSTLVSQGGGTGETSVFRISNNDSNVTLRANNTEFIQNSNGGTTIHAIWRSNGTMTLMELTDCKVVVNGEKGNAVTIGGGAFTYPAAETYGTYNFVNCEISAPGQAILFENAAMTEATVNIYGGTYITEDMTLRAGGVATVNVYGGYFQTNSGYTLMNVHQYATLNIYGGRFVSKTIDDTDDKWYSVISLGIGTDPIDQGMINIWGGHFEGDESLGQIFRELEGRALNLYSLTCKGGQYILTDGTPAEGILLEYASGETVYSGRSPVMYDGAQLRLAQTDKSSGGIRFATKLSKDVLDYAKFMAKDDSTISYGTIIVPLDYLMDADGNWIFGDFSIVSLEAAGLKYLNVVAENGIVENADGSITLLASISKIREQNYDRKFAAVGYVKYNLNGQDMYLYSAFDPANNARSLRELAEAALNDTAEKQDITYRYKVAENVYSRYSDEQRALLAMYVGCQVKEEIVKAPTTTEAGLKRVTCTVCGTYYEEIILPLTEEAVDPSAKSYKVLAIGENLAGALFSIEDALIAEGYEGSLVGVTNANEAFYAREAGAWCDTIIDPAEWEYVVLFLDESHFDEEFALTEEATALIEQIEAAYANATVEVIYPMMVL